MKNSNSVSKTNSLLKFSAFIWFLTATVGLWLFAYYLLEYYIIPAFKHGIAIWEQTRLPRGYIDGDAIGNIAVAIHLFAGFYISLFGPLQLIPHIRNKFPLFHRINGRIFIITAILTSMAGYYMVWVRGDEVGNLTQQVSISISGTLIIFFAIMSWKSAIQRKFTIHRMWALRLFMVANAAWFLRVGYQFWNLLVLGKVGYDSSVFFAPFFTIWTFGSYLLPLVMLEFYFVANRSKATLMRCIAAGFLLIFTIIVGLGSYNAFFGMWLPQIS